MYTEYFLGASLISFGHHAKLLLLNILKLKNINSINYLDFNHKDISCQTYSICLA